MKRFYGVSALALCAFAAPAYADVTPQQVWDDLEAYMQGFGYSVTATEAMDGSNLTLSDVVMSMQVPDEEVTVAFNMDSMTMTDQGDGTVKIGFPAVMPVTIKGSDGGDDVDVTVNLGQEAMELVVSGEPDNLTYDYSADKMTMALGKMFADGEEITPDMLRMDVEAGPLSGKSTVTRADGQQSVSQIMDFGNITYDIAFNDPEGDDAGMLNGLLNGVTTAGGTVMPLDIDYSDPAAMFAAGFGVDVTIGHQGGRMDFSVTERSGVTSGKTSSGAGSLTFAMSSDSLTYNLSSTGFSVDLSSPEMPLPISAQMAETGFKLEMPLKAAETPQDASFEFVLGGFQMADMLWNIFDPASNLPRDPATIRLALDATVTPFADLFDPEAMETIAMSGGVPGELNSVSLRELLVEAVGGKIVGAGAFTLDNTDLETFDGMPRPEGKLELSVSGANALIDKLIAMGLLAEEDAMGARMMMGMFAVPGDAPDTVNSVVEVTAEGHVLANGQRLK